MEYASFRGWVIHVPQPRRQLGRQFLVATADPENALRMVREIVGADAKAEIVTGVGKEQLLHRQMQDGDIFELGKNSAPAKAARLPP